MELEVVLFGIARDIAGSSKLKLTLADGASVKVLKKQLIAEYPEMSKLRSIAFAVDADYVDDDYQLRDKEEIVIIPPVSGG
ncbi:MAG: MoaD/ThiS family protein [Cytophagales bacterium]|nr:MoaD/ThiS family protein [Cytophagales bacterium]